MILILGLKTGSFKIAILPSTGGGGHATLQRTRKAVVRPTPSGVIKLSIFFKNKNKQSLISCYLPDQEKIPEKALVKNMNLKFTYIS